MDTHIESGSYLPITTIVESAAAKHPFHDELNSNFSTFEGPADLITNLTPSTVQNTLMPRYNNLHSDFLLPLHTFEQPIMHQKHTADISKTLRDQRRESIDTLYLSPLSNPEDGVSVLLQSDGKEYAFTIHRHLLCHFSSYFKKLLARIPVVKTIKVKRFNYINELDFDFYSRDKAISEETELEVPVVVRLPYTSPCSPEIRLPRKLGEVKPVVFAALVEWLYRGFPDRLFPPPDFNVSAAILIELWVLAGSLEIPACQNDCIVGIERWRMQTNVIETGMLEWIYENTKRYPRGSCGLRNLLIDQCAWVLDEEWLLDGIGPADNADMFPKEALVDIVARMRGIMRRGNESFGLFGFVGQRKGHYWVA